MGIKEDVLIVSINIRAWTLEGSLYYCLYILCMVESLPNKMFCFFLKSANIVGPGSKHSCREGTDRMSTRTLFLRMKKANQYLSLGEILPQLSTVLFNQHW